MVSYWDLYRTLRFEYTHFIRKISRNVLAKRNLKFHRTQLQELRREIKKKYLDLAHYYNSEEKYMYTKRAVLFKFAKISKQSFK